MQDLHHQQYYSASKREPAKKKGKRLLLRNLVLVRLPTAPEDHLQCSCAVSAARREAISFGDLGFRVQQLRIEQSLVELASSNLEKYPPTQEPSALRNHMIHES